MCMVSKNLKDHFPIIRDRAAVLADINGNRQLLQLFHSWEKEQQEEFLDLCSGARGFKLLYDSFLRKWSIRNTFRPDWRIFCPVS